jgi:hypothetical protein
MLKSVYDTNADNIVDHAALADTAPWTGITGKPASFTPSAHETTHLDNGSDVIPLASTTRTGLSPQIPSSNPAKQFHRGDNTYAQANYPDLTNIPASFVPSAHASTHVTAGSDIIVPASSSTSGLLKQVSGNTTDFVDGTNTCQNLISAIQPTIFALRLRTFSSIGNPTMEVDQRSAGNSVTLAAGSFAPMIIDRWQANKSAATATATVQQSSNLLTAPSTNFYITSKSLLTTIGTAQGSLAAGEFLTIGQTVEGPRLRELINDVHSVQLLVNSSVAGSFTMALRNVTGTAYSYVKLFALSANTWTWVTIPNIAVWTPSSTWPLTPGSGGYALTICLGAGTTYTTATQGSWVAGSFVAASGQTNLMASAGAQFSIAFVQHEPGPICSTPIDCPFTPDNYDACLRYFCKSWDYATAVGTASAVGVGGWVVPVAATTLFYGHEIFPKPMAKAPTVTIYNYSTGAANSISAPGAGNVTVSSVGNINSRGFPQITISSGTGVTVGPAYFHYTADTGW